MAMIRIHHRTTYRYARDVALGPHRLLLRPRESNDIRLIAIDLTCDPPAAIMWTTDVFGNALATASFQQPAAALTIDSRVEIEHRGEAWPVFGIAFEAISYPFSYSEDDDAVLGVLRRPQFPDPDRRLSAWARGFVGGDPTDTLSLLQDLNAGASASLIYEVREDEGTQPPLESLDRGRGSCRDIAVLMAEAARCLGFGARIVSGYLCAADDSGMLGSLGAGSTHAWVEIYLPGAGWITFDPTNRKMGGSDLVPVAVGRDIRQVMPVSGSFAGVPSDFLGMTVEVGVTPL
jgi:transglutaminase-like putative cysteine protease